MGRANAINELADSITDSISSMLGVNRDGFAEAFSRGGLIKDVFLYIAYRLNKQMPGLLLLSDAEEERLKAVVKEVEADETDRDQTT